MTVKMVETEEEMKKAYEIRRTVFIEEQNVPPEIEVDQYEDEAIHFICYDDEKVIGAGRLRFVGEHGKLERICVLKPYRGKSFGKKIIEAMEKEIVNNNYSKALLNAQTHAKEFYERIGYQVISDEFIEAGIPHVTMEKKLK